MRSSHGGPRANAGRKPSPAARRVRVTVYVSESTAARLDAAGGTRGAVAAKVVEAWAKRERWRAESDARFKERKAHARTDP